MFKMRYDDYLNITKRMQHVPHTDIQDELIWSLWHYGVASILC